MKRTDADALREFNQLESLAFIRVIQQATRALHQLRLRIDRTCIVWFATPARSITGFFRGRWFCKERNALTLRPARRTRRAAINLRRADAKHKLPVEPRVPCDHGLPQLVVHLERDHRTEIKTDLSASCDQTLCAFCASLRPDRKSTRLNSSHVSESR